MTEAANSGADAPVRNPLPLGIYFGLPEEDYFDDEGLGSTALKALAQDPIEYQEKKLFGIEKEESAALLWGKMLHARVLEGRKVFEDRYLVAPAFSDFPKPPLDTIDQLRNHAKNWNAMIEACKGKKDKESKAIAKRKPIVLAAAKTKADIISAIRAADHETLIWQEIKDKFDAQLSDAGKIEVSKDAFQKIERAARWMNENPKLHLMMENGTFKDTYIDPKKNLIPTAREVAIFVEYEGVRLRAKIDLLQPHGMFDLKSFRPRRNWRVMGAASGVLDRVIGYIIADERYDLQAAAYRIVWEEARKLFEAGQVFGASDREMTLLREAFSRGDQIRWSWIFVKNAGAPQTIVAEFSLSSFALGSARDDIERAIAAYRQLSAEFGKDKEWVPSHEAIVITDQDLPAFLGQ